MAPTYRLRPLFRKPQEWLNSKASPSIADRRALIRKAAKGMDRVVLCMKWGPLYGPDYVNVLYNATRAHLTGSYRFVCLTDDPSGFVSGIESFPIPDIGCTPNMWRHGAWPKLSVFAQDLYGLTGRALFIDMDTIICGPLDRFFDDPAPLIGIDTGPGWHPGGKQGGSDAELGTGVFAFNLGQQSQILDRFRAAPEQAFESCDIEQVWVQKQATSVAYWPEGWVISFKRWLRQPIGLDLFLPPKAPPPSAGMVAFHGDPRPITLVRPGRAKWDKFPHLGHGQVAWMRDYWLRNGGRITIN